MTNNKDAVIYDKGYSRTKKRNWTTYIPPTLPKGQKQLTSIEANGYYDQKCAFGRLKNMPKILSDTVNIKTVLKISKIVRVLAAVTNYLCQDTPLFSDTKEKTEIAERFLVQLESNPSNEKLQDSRLVKVLQA